MFDESQLQLYPIELADPSRNSPLYNLACIDINVFLHLSEEIRYEANENKLNIVTKEEVMNFIRKMNDRISKNDKLSIVYKFLKGDYSDLIKICGTIDNEMICHIQKRLVEAEKFYFDVVTDGLFCSTCDEIYADIASHGGIFKVK